MDRSKGIGGSEAAAAVGLDPLRWPALSRDERVSAVQALHAYGYTSAAIGEYLGLASSTVRDYLNDPSRTQARHRQRRYSVLGVPGTSELAPEQWAGVTISDKGAKARGRQVWAIRSHRRTA